LPNLCDCFEFTLFTWDLSDYFEPPLTVLEEAISAAMGGMIGVELEPEAQADVNVCCDEEGSYGLEFAAEASVEARLVLGPNPEWSFGGAEIETPDGKTLSVGAFSASFDLNSFFGASISGEISSSCNFEEPYATLSGSVFAGFDAGTSLSITVGKSEGALPFETTVIEVSIGLHAYVEASVTYDSRTGLEYCVTSEGVYLEIFAVAPFGYEWYPLDDPSTPDIKETRRYLIEAAELCAPSAPMNLLRMGHEAQTDLLLSQVDEVRQANAATASTDEGVCATVELQIDQELVVTRSAVEATLGIENLSDDPITNLSFQIDIFDTAGNRVNDLFVIQVPTLTGLTGVNSLGTLAGNSLGTARWIIIPTDDAAPSGPTEYRVGGSLVYHQGGRQVAIPFQADSVTVLPNPQLEIHYFHQRDVFADDPFTDVIEPSQPYSLAVLIENYGAGVAKNLSITSAQPQIIENEKGLLIDFRIVATEVAGQPLSPSLTANFGDLGPGQTVIGQWLLTSTLQGHFVEYSATFQHLDGLGDPRLSLIKSVDIHELIHLVNAGENSDMRPDFLTNDDGDTLGLPDTLWFSDGSQATVEVAADVEVSGDGLSRTLTAGVSSGWSYFSVVLPEQPGLRLVKVVRQDGSEIPVGANLWTTDRTFLQPTQRPIDEDRVHLLDFDSTGTYTLVFEEFTLPAVAVQQVGQPIPAQRTTPVDSIDVVFSRAIDLYSFDAADLTLSRDGDVVAINGVLTVTPLGGSTYRISGLASTTTAVGEYTLTVASDGLLDTAGTPGASGSASTSWSMGEKAPYVTIIRGVTPGSTIAGPLDTLVVEFSVPVDANSFSVDDLTLTRDGGANLLTEATGVTITKIADNPYSGDTSSATRYRISGLTGLTQADGDYALTLLSTGVATEGGTSGIGSYVLEWTTHTTGPQAAINVAFLPGSITNSTSGSVIGRLPEAVARVVIVNATTGQELGDGVVAGTQFTANVDLLTPGVHQLRVRVLDAIGNASETPLTVLVDQTAPVVVEILGFPQQPGSSPVEELTILFAEALSPASVTLAAFSLVRNDGANLLVGSHATITLVETNSVRFSGLSSLTNFTGLYTFTVLADSVTDLAGNALTEETSATWSLGQLTVPDTIPPTSSVTALPNLSTANFVVSWEGTDDPEGSGIASYNIYVSDNGGEYTPWLTGTTSTTGTYTGLNGHTYAFCSVAIDSQGNTEAAPATADATTTIINQFPEVLDALFSLGENAPAGQALGFAEASDPDEFDTFTFSIVGGNVNDAFAIDSITGEITVLNSAAIDFETTPEFTLTVQATDQYGAAGTATVTVTLIDANDIPKLLAGGGNTTYSQKANKKNPVSVVPNLILNDADLSSAFKLGGGSLTLSLDAVAKLTKKGPKFFDTITGLSNTAVIGTAGDLVYEGGALKLTIQLHAESTAAQVQAFLRNIRFSTKGAGLKRSTRTFQAHVTDNAGETSSLLECTLNVVQK